MENKHTPAYSIDFVEQKERYIESLTEQVATLTVENEKLKSEAKFFQRDFEQIPKLQKENSRLREERKELGEIAKAINKEIDIVLTNAGAHQSHHFASQCIKSLVESLLSKLPEVPNTTLTKEQMRQQEDLSEQREEYD